MNSKTFNKNSFFIKKDKFIQSLLGMSSYSILTNSRKEIITKLKRIPSIRLTSFITIKSKYIISKFIKKTIKANFICKQITFKKKYERNDEDINYCRLVKKKDFKYLKKISLENSSNSHFVQDKKLPYNFRKNFRYNWLNNYFKKKRGDILIVYEKRNIQGFLLLIIKKNTFIVDLIVTSKKNRKQGVARSLLNYVNNFYLKKKNSVIIAGTQSNNISAIKFYYKMNFKKVHEAYIYHIHKN